MTWEWLALAGLALVALVLLVALAGVRRRTTREIAAAHAETAALRDRLDRLEREREREREQEQQELAPVREEPEFTITGLGDGEGEIEPVRLERAVFADHVLRESVIRLGSLAHGVRRGLSAESRNRIRFEMRRELRRARKERRAEQREAYREWQARKRADLTEDDLRETA
jgi:hypothetical protein